MPTNASSEYADRCRAGISRLREQAQAATPGPWEATLNGRVLGPPPRIPSMCVVDSPVAESHSGNAAHIATWSGSSVLLVLDGWERQLAGYLTTLDDHAELYAGSVMPSCRVDGSDLPCNDVRRAEAGLADLARLVDTINGSSR